MLGCGIQYVDVKANLIVNADSNVQSSCRKCWTWMREGG